MFHVFFPGHLICTFKFQVKFTEGYVFYPHSPPGNIPAHVSRPFRSHLMSWQRGNQDEEDDVQQL